MGGWGGGGIVPSLFRYRQVSVYTIYFVVKNGGMTVLKREL